MTKILMKNELKSRIRQILFATVLITITVFVIAPASAEYPYHIVDNPAGSAGGAALLIVTGDQCYPNPLPPISIDGRLVYAAQWSPPFPLLPNTCYVAFFIPVETAHDKNPWVCISDLSGMCDSNTVKLDLYKPTPTPSPEFPSPLLPEIMVIGFLGTVLFLDRIGKN